MKNQISIEILLSMLVAILLAAVIMRLLAHLPIASYTLHVEKSLLSANFSLERIEGTCTPCVIK